jgi:hypothetical protein
VRVWSSPRPPKLSSLCNSTPDIKTNIFRKLWHSTTLKRQSLGEGGLYWGEFILHALVAAYLTHILYNFCCILLEPSRRDNLVQKKRNIILDKTLKRPIFFLPFEYWAWILLFVMPILRRQYLIPVHRTVDTVEKVCRVVQHMQFFSQWNYGI